MLTRKLKPQIWNDKDIMSVKNYTLSNREVLLSNMYINIIVGFVKFRKPRTFFKDLGLLLDRPSYLCKSKFQKIERELVVNLLKVPQELYNLYLYIRKSKIKNPSYDFKNIKSNLVIKYKKRRPNEIMKMNSNHFINISLHFYNFY